ncbi:HD domain-containing phosphohydrolase [Undibacterium sp. SXout11W]|uniref:HD domain-containing phosphohydrolase n=1 Tax=Undibacterium sp. SXout11W TaxID=3413050 RepID=UPI003BF07FC8
MPLTASPLEVTQPLLLESAALLSAAHREIHIAESRYRRLFETVQDGILVLNAETTQIEDVNPYLINMLGYSYDEFLAKKIWEIGAFEDTGMRHANFIELKQKLLIPYDNFPLITKDGVRIFVEFVSSIFEFDGIQVIQCNIRDNTKRHLAEVALVSTTRALKILSESNVALLRAKTESSLLEEFCRIVVETGGYLMAWIGQAEDGYSKKVTSLARYGLDDGYLDFAEITWNDCEHGNGPTGRAIREKQVQFVENVATDPAMKPWRDEALKRGYQSTIAIPFELYEGAMATLTLYSSQIQNWSVPERQLLQEITADLAFGIKALQTAAAKIQYQNNLRESLEKTIEVIAATAEERDSYTAGHQRRVADLCTHIATELGLSKDRTHGLHLAASVHDLGKISIPAEILSKPRRLSSVEFDLIKEHPMIGFNILSKVSFPWEIAKIIVQHHERIDGSGYPKGLKGDEILLESKILAVADVVEAIASHRPYRAALGVKVALDEITINRGITFAPDVVDACLRVFNEQAYVLENC